jgi:hypothetical protein
MGSRAKTLGQDVTSGEEPSPVGKRGPRVDAKIRAHLGRKLKSAYQSLVDEPVPERFTRLLEELRSKEGKS